MNSVNLIGRLGADPELRHGSNGTPWATARMAVNDNYGENKRTYWFPLVFFSKNAEIAEKYLSKGSRLGVQGKLVVREWENKNGDKRTTTEIHVQSFDLLGDQQGANGNGGGGKSRQHQNDDDMPPDDDIPF